MPDVDDADYLDEAMRMDPYDAAVKYLTEHPEEIPKVWLHPREYRASGGILFMFLTDDKTPNLSEDGKTIKYCCPTLYTSFPEEYPHIAQELKDEMQRAGIPQFFDTMYPDEAVKTLNSFARVQRFADGFLGRTPPTRYVPDDPEPVQPVPTQPSEPQYGAL